MQLERKVLAWFATGDCGQSSKAMAFAATKIDQKTHHPLDVSDFGRCRRLVEQVPEIVEHFDAIAKLSDTWSAIIDKWDELVSLYDEERDAKRSPKTYALLREIQDGARGGTS